MGLVNFTHDGIRREFAFLISPHFEDYWDDLYVIVALHGGNMTATRFLETTRIRNLISGVPGTSLDNAVITFASTGPSAPVVPMIPPVLVIVPQGLAGLDDNDSGSWNNGVMYSGARVMRRHADDAGFIVEAKRYGMRLAREWMINRHGYDPGDPTRGALLMGFSNGGVMALRAAAAYPGEFGAVAAVAATYGGWTFDGHNTALLQPPHLWIAGMPMIQIHGTNDPLILPIGGTSPDTIQQAQRFMQPGLAPSYAVNFVPPPNG